jgi:SM-20-related protein
LEISIIDNACNADMHAQVFAFLNQPSWAFGWKSHPVNDPFAFWHKHFAGNPRPDHRDQGGLEKQNECAGELAEKAPLLHEHWLQLAKFVKGEHRLVRCYANGMPYGTDGSVHTDSKSESSLTAIYYPHPQWHPDWGGETALFNNARTDLVTSVFPKPNRLLIFPGTIPHGARGVTRVCPVMRITLMYKIELVADAPPA